MLRKPFYSLALALAMLLGLVTVSFASASSRPVAQMDMPTETPAAGPVSEAAPLPETIGTPQAYYDPSYSGTMGAMDCPMMESMSGTSGMSSMSGMGGMGEMGSMSGMASMGGMNMNGSMVTGPTFWSLNPWMLLGWAVLAVTVLAGMALLVFGIVLVMRRVRA